MTILLAGRPAIRLLLIAFAVLSAPAVFAGVMGDVNGDGIVNCADLAIVKAAFGKSIGQPGFDVRADVNKDGVVNILDLSTVARAMPAGVDCSTAVVVPNVVGLALAAASSTIAAAHLVAGTVTEQTSATIAAGLVIGESPAAGSSATSGSAVSLVISTGVAKVTVPNVLGLTQAAATKAITGAGLVVGSVTPQSSSTVAAGLVIRESPSAGSSVAANSAVGFVVSTGAAKVAVPNVVVQTQSVATSAITAAGLKVGTVTTQSSPTAAAGLVISESPPAGTSVITGSAVNLVLSTGMVLVPNVVDKTQAGATTSITSAGLKLGTVTTQTSTTVAAGLVISESPPAGTTVTLASSVNLVVSSGGQSISTAIGASVPAAAAGLITTFYSASTTVAISGTIPTLPDGSVPVLFAGDGENDPLLLAVGSTTGTLDANTTAIGLVRTALGLVVTQAPLTSSVLASAIQASPNYAKLLSDITTSLTTGQSPLDSDTVPQDALTVAQDAIVTLNTNGVLNAATAKIKAAAAIQVNPPLPYYFINNSQPFNRLFLTDDPGTMNVNAMNQTFIAWQFDTSDSNGALSSNVISQPLQSTYLQLIGYYGGSATTTPLPGASPEFTLTLSQSATTKNQNSLAAVNQFGVFLASVASGVTPDNAQLQCFSAAVSATFGPQLAVLVGEPTAASALSYFRSNFLSPVAIFKVVTSCTGSPSSAINTLFGKSAGQLWKILNLVKAGVSTLGGAAETFNYWDFPSQDYTICKTNGGITSFPCVTLQLAPTVPSVAVGSTVTLTATASNSSGSFPVPSNLQWSSDTTSVATVSASTNGTAVVTGVSAGTATITVTDPVSQATASVIVTVTNPSVCSGTPSFNSLYTVADQYGDHTIYAVFCGLGVPSGTQSINVIYTQNLFYVNTGQPVAGNGVSAPTTWLLYTTPGPGDAVTAEFGGYGSDYTGSFGITVLFPDGSQTTHSVSF